MKCCGVAGPDDWNKNVYFNCSNELNKSGEKCGVPHSCCINVLLFFCIFQYFSYIIAMQFELVTEKQMIEK